MFTHISNASKVALVALVKHLQRLEFAFIDCQIKTDHLTRFGAREISRSRYLKELARALEAATLQGKWTI